MFIRLYYSSICAFDTLKCTCLSVCRYIEPEACVCVCARVCVCASGRMCVCECVCACVCVCARARVCVCVRASRPHSLSRVVFRFLYTLRRFTSQVFRLVQTLCNWWICQTWTRWAQWVCFLEWTVDYLPWWVVRMRRCQHPGHVIPPRRAAPCHNHGVKEWRARMAAYDVCVEMVMPWTCFKI